MAAGVIKKLLRNRELVEREEVPNCFISFPSEKHVFITVGILSFSFFVW